MLIHVLRRDKEKVQRNHQAIIFLQTWVRELHELETFLRHGTAFLMASLCTERKSTKRDRGAAHLNETDFVSTTVVLAFLY